MECPVSPVYRTTAQQKLRSKNAAKIYRYGSPKLRDLLREKCRIRMREARQCSYQQRRETTDSFSGRLKMNDILWEELAEVEQDIKLQEEIYKELVDEVNDWFVEQQEEEESYLIRAAESNDVICPVCQKYALQVTIASGVDINEMTANVQCNYLCACGVSFSNCGNMEQLRSALQTKINQHEQTCLSQLNFFVEPRLTAQQLPNSDNLLTGMCGACDYLCSF